MYSKAYHNCSSSLLTNNLLHVFKNTSSIRKLAQKILQRFFNSTKTSNIFIYYKKKSFSLRSPRKILTF